MIEPGNNFGLWGKRKHNYPPGFGIGGVMEKGERLGNTYQEQERPEGKEIAIPPRLKKTSEERLFPFEVCEAETYEILYVFGKLDGNIKVISYY